MGRYLEWSYHSKYQAPFSVLRTPDSGPGFRFLFSGLWARLPFSALGVLKTDGKRTRVRRTEDGKRTRVRKTEDGKRTRVRKTEDGKRTRVRRTEDGKRKTENGIPIGRQYAVSLPRRVDLQMAGVNKVFFSLLVTVFGSPVFAVTIYKCTALGGNTKPADQIQLVEASDYATAGKPAASLSGDKISATNCQVRGDGGDQVLVWFCGNQNPYFGYVASLNKATLAVSLFNFKLSPNRAITAGTNFDYQCVVQK